ncbi:MAG: hypothetical protein K5681_06780 [Treponema sp.]|nr:hypothetical protein [Treponema sp.]
MKTNKITKTFFPPEEYMHKCTMREEEQLPILIGANLIFMLLFALFGIVLFLSNYPILGLGGLCLLAFFATSLLLIKKTHIHKGSWVTTVAITLLSAVVCFGSPFVQTNFLPYRDSCFIVVMSVCNYIISLRRRQLHSYFILAAIIWIILLTTTYMPLFREDFSTFLMNAVICSLAILTTNTSLLLFDKFTRNVVERAIENEQKSVKAFDKISAVINETKEGLNIGKQLSKSTEKANQSVIEINDLYMYINTETTNLSDQAVSIKDSSNQINDKAEQMMQSVHNQSQSISQSSAALTQMSASLSNISNIASQQRSGMNEIVKTLDSHLILLQKLVDNVQMVKTSSENISTFVAAVNKIASQTGLLAMNASIEAAHAGSLGQGFSVIAQEIRKLSDETSKNAQKITETLQSNEEIVNITSESVNTFSNFTKKTTEELRSTINNMEEILSGISDIDAGTKDVTNAFSQIVNDADVNSRLADGVTNEIIQQNAVLQKISDGTKELQEKISNLDGLLSNIKMAIEEIEQNASANEDVAEKISGALN